MTANSAADSTRPIPFSRWLAWGVFGLVLLIFAANLTLSLAGCLPPFLLEGLENNLGNRFTNHLVDFLAIGFAFLGALIITYRPGNRIGWLASLNGLFFSFGFFTFTFGLCSVRGTLNLPGSHIFIWLFNIGFWLNFLLMGLFIMLFPNGKFLSSRWKRLSLIFIGLNSVLNILSFFWPGQLIYIEPNPAPEIQNPLSFPFDPPTLLDSLVRDGSFLSGILFTLLALLSLTIRWRRARGDERQQIKWVALFLMTAGSLFIIVELIGSTVYPAIFDGLFYPLELAVFFLGFPLVFGLAIFKYRLYDIDIIIRRTLVYGLVTLTLAGIYFGSVILLQRFFTGVTEQQSPLAIVISTLLIAALFNPLRRRIQAFIDRRFYRRKYDAAQTLAQFAHTARDEVELDALAAELVRVSAETMQPDHISLWIKTD